MPDLTVADIAEKLSAQTGEGRPYHERQIRHWAQNGLFGNDFLRNTIGRTSPRTFGDVAIGRARLLAALVKLGFEIDQLRVTAHLLDKMAPEDEARIYGPTGRRPMNAALEYVVGAAQANAPETWFFQFWAAANGEVHAGGFTTVKRENAFLDGAYPVHIAIDASRLLKPLFSEA